jgi:hypothetical protein
MTSSELRNSGSRRAFSPYLTCSGASHYRTLTKRCLDWTRAEVAVLFEPESARRAILLRTLQTVIKEITL